MFVRNYIDENVKVILAEFNKNKIKLKLLKLLDNFISLFSTVCKESYL